MSDETKVWFFNEKPSVFLREHRMMYLMVNAIAKRAAQLQSGERAQVQLAEGPSDPVKLAIAEFAADKLVIEPRRPRKIVQEKPMIVL